MYAHGNTVMTILLLAHYKFYLVNNPPPDLTTVEQMCLK